MGTLFFAGQIVGTRVSARDHAVKDPPATESARSADADRPVDTGRPLNSSAMAAAVAAARGDALLEALLTELSRSYTHLKMDQVQAPYYIEYRVNDVDDYSAEAA